MTISSQRTQRNYLVQLPRGGLCVCITILLQRSEQPFDYSYITELKLDGIRLILSKIDNKIWLYTRHNNEVTAKFPELLTIDIPAGTVLDGEIIVTDPAGKPDFEAVMSRFQAHNY
jgi:DNA ligase 1